MKKKKLLTDRSGELHERLIEEQAVALQKEVDAEVLRSMFKQLGWHEVVLYPMTYETGNEIDKWVSENVKGRSHWTHGLVWLFEDSRDAMWFKLRWLA